MYRLRGLRVRLDRISYLALALTIPLAWVLLQGYRLDSLLLQVIGISGIVTMLIIAFIRPVIASLLRGPRVDLDLVYTLLHMRLVSSGKPPAGKVLASVSREGMYGYYSDVFRRAVTLAREWGYNLTDALSYLAKEVGEKTFREVIQRMAATLKLGADLEVFLDTEYDTLFHEYRYHYQRVINNMRVLLGVYIAIMAALVFALSSFMLLGFFFGGSSRLLVQAYIVSSLVVLVLGGLIIFLLPREHFDVKGREARENPLIRLSDLLAVAGILLSITISILYLRGKQYTPEVLGMTVALAGLPLIPAGIVALIHESRVQDIDIFFPVFIRSLGSFVQTIPSLKHAITQVLRADLGKLTRLVMRFSSRLENEIPPHIAWKRFSIESGSELVRRGSAIFQDTMEYGGDTSLAGRVISDHNNALLGLRRLRAQISSNFTSTTIIIHATVVAISIFILGLIGYFNTILQALLEGLTPEVASFIFINIVDIEFLNKIIYLFIFTLTLVNSYLIAKVRPFSLRSFWIYLGILLVITGVSTYLSTKAVDYVLGTMGGFEAPLPG
ncbi:MAG: type II secretion system F family protein [Desulfurococcales archaeon]|nr:type II secretion system F family protein [Desulfurococcales archaeon]